MESAESGSVSVHVTVAMPFDLLSLSSPTHNIRMKVSQIETLSKTSTDLSLSLQRCEFVLNMEEFHNFHDSLVQLYSDTS